MSTTDVRQWAKTHGIDIGGHGRIPRHVQDQFDAAHPASEAGGAYPEESGLDSGVGAGPAYDGGVTEADFLPEIPADVEETRETRPTRPPSPPRHGRGPFARLRTPSKKAAGKRPPRMSLAGFIEDIWGQMAWAAVQVPPLQRLLQVQAPYAGIALDDAISGTVADVVLQPVARAEEKAKAVGGVVCPPMALMLVLATAPEPVERDGQLVIPEPSVQHKSALMGLRWSLILMADAYTSRWDEIIARGEATAERARQADKMMAYILGWDTGQEDGQEEQEEDAAVSAEENAIRRAQAIFGGDQ